MKNEKKKFEAWVVGQGVWVKIKIKMRMIQVYEGRDFNRSLNLFLFHHFSIIFLVCCLNEFQRVGSLNSIKGV